MCWTRRIIVKDFFLTEVESTHHGTCKNRDWTTLCVRLCEELFKITLFNGQIPN